MTQFKKRAIIIVLWLVFMALVNMILFNVESVVYHDKARDELRDLAPQVLDLGKCVGVRAAQLLVLRCNAVELLVGLVEAALGVVKVGLRVRERRGREPGACQHAGAQAHERAQQLAARERRMGGIERCAVMIPEFGHEVLPGAAFKVRVPPW